MYILFSGEGPTDLGSSADASVICEGERYLYGPMAVIVDRIVEDRYEYSPLEAQACGFVSENQLSTRANELRAVRKALGLPGRKRARETRYFFNNARMLGRIARERQTELNVEVVAVLFRDSDGTASAGRGLWDEKRDSMLHGFDVEGFEKGVPMIPKPKSEAWVLCALKNRYQGCAALEERSGNDRSPNSLKSELEGVLGGPPSRDVLCDMVWNGRIDYREIDMPSFTAFLDRMRDVIQ